MYALEFRPMGPMASSPHDGAIDVFHHHWPPLLPPLASVISRSLHPPQLPVRERSSIRWRIRTRRAASRPSERSDRLPGDLHQLVVLERQLLVAIFRDHVHVFPEKLHVP